ncbi:GNAT family N-acetyltransferase (plasmid) [Cupriavidus necator]|nr:GNAT family N-acetyltransferase [Cupriavidus necator]
MMIRSETPTCHHRAEVSKLAVHPAYRDQNIVLRAVRQIVVKADALGIEQLFLHVREGSPTHLLWERFGFKSYGVLGVVQKPAFLRYTDELNRPA